MPKHYNKPTGLFYFPLLILCVLASCITKKEITYLQDYSGTNPEFMPFAQRGPYKLQPKDVLSIQMNVPNFEDKTFLKEAAATGTASSTTTTTTNPYLSGYVVDDSGYVALPVVGRLKMGGLSIAEATQLLQGTLAKLFVNASCSIKLANFTVYVMGEVRQPKPVVVPSDEANLLQVLAMAGDLTDMADRRAVKLIRPQQNQGYKIVSIDLTDRKMISSEHFFLAPNDVIYVETTAKSKLDPNAISKIQLVTGFVNILFFVTNLIVILGR